MKYSAPLLASVGLAAAQSSVVTVLLPQFNPQAIDASVIAAAPTATTYRLNCPPGADSSDCGVPPEYELVYGPSTFGFTVAIEDDSAATAACKINLSRDTADCVGTVTEGSSSTVTSEIITGLSSLLMPITVTAGLDKLAASTTGAGTSPTTAASTGTSTSTSTSTSSGAAESTAATSSTQSGGVPPQITQNAVLVGAAALVGGAMLI
ncbi:hypothetical protein VTH82DRAFT_2036 [Thermothelomyces myriococcoides]